MRRFRPQKECRFLRDQSVQRFLAEVDYSSPSIRPCQARVRYYMTYGIKSMRYSKHPWYDTVWFNGVLALVVIALAVEAVIEIWSHV